MIKTKSKRCTVCKNTFYRKPGRGIKAWEKQKTCSIECRSKRMKRQKIGFQKGHTGYKNSGNFEKGRKPWNLGDKGRKDWHNISGLKPGNNKGKKASEETRAKIRLARAKQDMSHMQGKNHPNWKGGRTPLTKKIRRLYKSVEWRKSVFERDNYTCQKCGQRGGRLNADHIKPFSKLLDENNINTIEQAKSCLKLWDVSNGRTLCENCHQKTSTFGSKSIIKS